MDRDDAYLAQMRDTVRKVKSYTDGMTREEFLNDEKTQSAVTMQLILIGELSKKLSIITKERIDLPWRKMAGLRDVAVHDYFSLDTEAIWDTITNHFALLEEKLSGDSSH